jgi:hypothetical protein
MPVLEVPLLLEQSMASTIVVVLLAAGQLLILLIILAEGELFRSSVLCVSFLLHFKLVRCTLPCCWSVES